MACSSPPPPDWKLSKWGFFEGIEGNDIAGYVVKAGSKVTAFKVGQKAGAFTPMGKHDKYGAYQGSTVTPEHTAFAIGENTSFDQAAALPLAALTAVVGLFVKLKLPEPTADGKPVPGADKTGLLVWGAGSAVGGYVIQLAKLAGLHVVAVAGSSTQHAKDLGADVVVNYRSDDVVSAVKEAASKVPIKHAYDAISEPPTTETIATILSQLDGGTITTLLPTDYLNGKLPSNVTVDRTSVGSAHAEDAALAEKWIRQIAAWVDDGTFKASPVQVVQGGLGGVPQGLKLLEEGKVNAAKLVCE
jgi:NADPH:quinone reductase-like Zn-dependent oxidoreductase